MNWRKKIIKEQIDKFLKRIDLGKIYYFQRDHDSKTFSLALSGRKLEVIFNENPLRCGNQNFVLFLKREDKVTEFFEFSLLEGITIIPLKHVIKIAIESCNIEQVMDLTQNSITLNLDFKCFIPNELNNPVIPEFNAFAKAALEFMPHSIHPLKGHLSRIISRPEIQSYFDEKLIKNLLDYMQK